MGHIRWKEGAKEEMLILREENANMTVAEFTMVCLSRTTLARSKYLQV
jgi:hypothetical protein